MKNKIKILVVALVIIPLGMMMVLIIVKGKYTLTNEQIIEKIRETDNYSQKINITFKNQIKEYEEDAEIFSDKDGGLKIDLGGDRTKIYKDGHIFVKDNRDQYEIDENFDIVYPLTFMENILENNITSIEEGHEEWANTEYIKVNLKINKNNNHIDRATVYLDKKNCRPIVTRIYSKNNDESITIKYLEFKKLEKWLVFHKIT